MMFLRHLLSVLVLPFTVAVVVPYVLLGREIGGSAVMAQATGLLVISIGLALVVRTIAFFASLGRGTLAPWDPPRRLVIRGVYQHVRNPMISGVLLILIGESLLFASSAVGMWAAAVFAINAIYIPLIEEPGLQDRFGHQYQEYQRQVPRWIPRLSAWHPSGTSAAARSHLTAVAGDEGPP
jgi:protein-S-isoprenylcysteine O-methyltransferase Ste14